MSYEYKHKVMLYEIAESFFKDLVQYDSETGEMLNEADIREELNGVRDEIKHVYAQATKTDEYEAKAKAWDVMKKDFEGIADTPIGQQMLFNMSVIMERVENGDYND